jgi:hypothetical protein
MLNTPIRVHKLSALAVANSSPSPQARASSRSPPANALWHITPPISTPFATCTRLPVARARHSMPSHPRQLNAESCGPAVAPAARRSGGRRSVMSIYGGNCCDDEGDGDDDSHGGPDYGTGVSEQVWHHGRRDYGGSNCQPGGPRASCAGHCVIASDAKRRKPDQAGGEGWLGSRRRREQQRTPSLRWSVYRRLLSTMLVPVDICRTSFG